MDSDQDIDLFNRQCYGLHPILLTSYDDMIACLMGTFFTCTFVFKKTL